jgi:hypothetical protein
MFKSLDLRPYVRSLVKTMMKIVELSSLYPHVKVLVHEDITARTFERLSEFISTPLDGAFACYTTDKQNYVSREDAERALGRHYRDLVERVWLRFLEFYDPATLSVRECEGLLSYLLIEYGEVVAAIDAELAAEAAVAAERKLAEARDVAARMSLEIKKSASSAKVSASKARATIKTTASKVGAPLIKSKSKKSRDGERATKGRPLAVRRTSRIEN